MVVRRACGIGLHLARRDRAAESVTFDLELGDVELDEHLSGGDDLTLLARRRGDAAREGSSEMPHFGRFDDGPGANRVGDGAESHPQGRGDGGDDANHADHASDMANAGDEIDRRVTGVRREVAGGETSGLEIDQQRRDETFDRRELLGREPSIGLMAEREDRLDGRRVGRRTARSSLRRSTQGDAGDIRAVHRRAPASMDRQDVAVCPLRARIDDAAEVETLLHGLGDGDGAGGASGHVGHAGHGEHLDAVAMHRREGHLLAAHRGAELVGDGDGERFAALRDGADDAGTKVGAGRGGCGGRGPRTREDREHSTEREQLGASQIDGVSIAELDDDRERAGGPPQAVGDGGGEDGEMEVAAA